MEYSVPFFNPLFYFPPSKIREELKNFKIYEACYHLPDIRNEGHAFLFSKIGRGYVYDGLRKRLGLQRISSFPLKLPPHQYM